MFIALTMAVPLQYVLFSVKIPFFVQDPSILHALNWIGLVVTLLGLVVYHIAKDPDEDEDATEEEKAANVIAMSPTVSPFGSRTPGMASPAPPNRKLKNSYRADSHDTESGRGRRGSF